LCWVSQGTVSASARFSEGDSRQTGLRYHPQTGHLPLYLHNLLINHPLLPDWFNESMEELDQEDEFNQSVEQSGGDTRCNQVFAYMLEER